jgi:hypothetical protein
MSDIKEAAQMGFLHAKRTMVSAIDVRLGTLNGSLELIKKGKPTLSELTEYTAKIEELEVLRDYIRNVMLWKVE